MKFQHGVRFHRSLTCGFFSTLLLSGSVLVGVLGTVLSAFAATITDGTYISTTVAEDYPGTGVQYFQTPGSAYPTLYTNGTLSQTNTSSEPASPYNASATATASLASDQLSIGLSGSYALIAGTAEMWDTLTFGNLPSGPGVSSGTVLGTLNMSINASAVPGYTYSTYESAYGLELYNPASFSPSGSDCGWTGPMNCGAPIGSSGLAYAAFAPGNFNFSVPITLGSLTSGQIAYIAEIEADTGNAASYTTALGIDPSITITGLYSGVTISSTSGANYIAPVALPAATWMFGSGLLGLLSVACRKRRR